MNLAWLLAVIQPREIAPHPSFRDSTYDQSGPARLAALVKGNRLASPFESDAVFEGPEHGLIDLVAGCLDPRKIGTSVSALRAAILNRQVEDKALQTALALVVCASAAELDDFETCFAVLTHATNSFSDGSDSDSQICRAVLLQQRALRSRDAGVPFRDFCIEAGLVASKFNPAGASQFDLGRGTTSTTAQALNAARESILDAASSLMNSEMLAAPDAAHLPTHRDRVRNQPATVPARAEAGSARVLRQFVQRLFHDEFGSKKKTFGGRKPDLFFELLGLEVNGHRDAYGARRDLALIRLLQSDGSESDLSDSLRLLRQALEKNDLQLALRRLRSAGPLSALSTDARQIIRSRLSFELLGAMELLVLTDAAEILAPSEAREALAAVLSSLRSDGPPDLPGQWQDRTLRRETAWVAAAVLSGACGAPTAVARMLLEEARAVTAEDQLLDRALRRAIISLDWDNVDDDVQNQWIALLRERRKVLPGVEEAVLSTLKLPVLAPETAPPFERVTYRLNNSIRLGIEWRPESGDVDVISEALVQAVDELTPGVYKHHATSVADVAAAAIVQWSSQELWDPLLDLLENQLAGRRERSAAFDRLARAGVALPAAARQRVSSIATRLLSELEVPSPFDDELLHPYPEALRFLAAHQVLGADETYDAIAVLGGSSQPEARKQGALTVAVLAGVAYREYLLGFALSFARDEDAEVRAVAGRALATLPRSDHMLGTVASRRLVELLNEDGLLVPRQILQALSDLPGEFDEDVRAAVRGLAVDHPSYLVRRAARRLVDRD